MTPHSSTLAWKIPWMEEPGGLQSMGSLIFYQCYDFPGVSGQVGSQLCIHTGAQRMLTFAPSPSLLHPSPVHHGRQR